MQNEIPEASRSDRSLLDLRTQLVKPDRRLLQTSGWKFSNWPGCAEASVSIVTSGSSRISDGRNRVKSDDEVAALLAVTGSERIWDTATVSERRTLVEDLADSVSIYPDRITVEVAGAPPFTVALDEVGLTQGCKPTSGLQHQQSPVP